MPTRVQVEAVVAQGVLEREPDFLLLLVLITQSRLEGLALEDQQEHLQEVLVATQFFLLLHLVVVVAGQEEIQLHKLV